jgi:hypothetical protein
LWQPGVSIPAGVGLSWRSVEEQRVLWTSDILAEPGIRWTPDVLQRVQTAAPRAVLTAPLLTKPVDPAALRELMQGAPTGPG